MDDPWGSPWTSEQKPPSPTKSGFGLGLEPPPRAFLSSASSPRIPAISGTSPWADDDDGFGDWAAADATSATPSGWGSGWGASEGEKSPHLTPTLKDDGFKKGSPIAVPGSIALSKPTNSSVFRQPSPLPSPSPSHDPWSSEFSLNVPPTDEILTPRYVPNSPDTDKHDTHPRKGYEEQDTGGGWGEDMANPSDANGWIKEDESGATTPAIEEEDHGGPPRETQDLNILIVESVEAETQEDESRRSSSSGDESGREAEQQDSPITSIDEDSRARLQVQRKASSKVQELVEKFDGIARQASEEPPPAIKRERVASRSRSPHVLGSGNQSDESDDFGDLEDAEDEEEETNGFSSPTSGSLERTPTPGKGHLAEQSTVPEEPEHSSSGVRDTIAKFGEINFDVKLGDVDKLFHDDKVRAIEPADATDADVSDRIVNDSFTEISERKTWYRISRQGSSRKHNAGDDDNYKLVAWPTASIRLDTIKIVRRWMEEDSITGRITLGGGATRSNMFGWDSAAEPVSLDKIFGKKPKAHSRAASLQQPAGSSPIGGSPQAAVPPSRKASGTPKSPTQRPLSLGAAQVPSFGWSTGATDGKATIAPVQPPAPRSGAPKPIPLDAPKPFLPPARTVPPPALKSGNPPAALAQPDQAEEDDDDDWGEMVSTPQTTAAQTAEPEQNLDIFSAPITAHKSVAVAHAPNNYSAPPPAPAPVAPSSDPWGSVDFSFFDKPATHNNVAPLQPSVAATPSPPPAVNNLTPVSSSPPSKRPAFAPPRRTVTFDDLLSPPADKTFSPTTPIAIVSPIPVSATTPTSPFATSRNAEDEAVNLLIRGLPNLSYMLR